MIEKPKKREVCGERIPYRIGWNEACDRWEKYHEQELRKLKEKASLPFKPLEIKADISIEKIIGDGHEQID